LPSPARAPRVRGTLVVREHGEGVTRMAAKKGKKKKGKKNKK
jgi:hypothetical protein